MRKHKNKLIAVAVVLAVLAGAWFWGGSPEINTPTPDLPPIAAATVDAEAPFYNLVATPQQEPSEPISTNDLPDLNLVYDIEEAAECAPPYCYTEVEEIQETPPEEQEEPEYTTPDVANPDFFATTPEEVVVPEFVPEELQIFAAYHPEMRDPINPENMEIGDGSFTVTLSVRVHTILYNMHLLDRDKHELIPADGWIFPPTEVTAYEGESVFNVLQREMRRNSIHMVSRWTPIFNSAYIEAINNIFEFDVGPLSGWMYRVNGWFPNFGASRYLLSDGDAIEWLFTVDLGRDLGVYWLGGEAGE